MLTTCPTKYPLPPWPSILLLPSLFPRTRDVGLFLTLSKCSRCMDWDEGVHRAPPCTKQCYIITHACPPQSTSAVNANDKHDIDASTWPHQSAVLAPNASNLTNPAYINRCHVCPTIPRLMSNITQMHTTFTTRQQQADNNKHNNHWCWQNYYCLLC